MRPPRSRAVRKRMLRSRRPTEHSGPAGAEGSTGVPQPCYGATCCPQPGPGVPGLWPRRQRGQRGQACERSAPQRRDLVSSPLIPRFSPCRRHRGPPRQRAGTRRRRGHGTAGGNSPRDPLCGGTDSQLGPAGSRAALAPECLSFGVSLPERLGSPGSCFRTLGTSVPAGSRAWSHGSRCRTCPWERVSSRHRL